MIDIEKDSINDERIIKMTISKTSGTASKNSKSYRVNIPTLWAKELGINEDDRKVKIRYDNGKIIIEKAEEVN